MVYKWKYSSLPVKAQIAGEEIERIIERDGQVAPTTLVEESRDENAPLHNCFEWDDSIAAERYRVTQANYIIRNITIEVVANEESERKEEPEIITRAFVSTASNSYEPIRIVLETPDKMERLLTQAKRDMESFISKYEILVELSEVIGTMKKVL